MEGGRNKLYKLKSEKGLKPRAEVEESVPNGVDPAQWRWHIGWRMTELGQAREQLGQAARAQQQVAHSTGSRPMIVGYDEMVFNYPLLFLSNNLRYNTDHSLTFQIL